MALPHCTLLLVSTEDPDDDDGDIDTLSNTNDENPTLGDQLSPQQTQDVHSVWTKFSAVLNEKPGHTSITEHHINTGEAKPIRLPPYRIPHAFRDTVRDELLEMERAGVIDHSAAPIVLVKKKILPYECA